MSKTVSVRLNDRVYRLFRKLAEQDNRPLSNFIETAALRYIEGGEFAGKSEAAVIRRSRELGKSLKRGIRDALAKRGRIA